MKIVYAYEGQLVLVAGVLCVVVCAAGNNVRVVNELHGIDKWVRIEQCDKVDQ